jgi:uncharacterized membrane protein YfcA
VDQSLTQIKIEAAIGAGLVITPVWVYLLQATALIASTIGAVCGAIIGINAVWRLMRRRRGAP